jgi:hypothetical protein
MNSNYRVFTGNRREYLLEFLHPNDSILGEYVCSAINVLGKDTLDITINELIGKGIYHYPLNICFVRHPTKS